MTLYKHLAVKIGLFHYEKYLFSLCISSLKVSSSSVIFPGRKTPAFSGYRPQVKFDFTEMQTSGQQTFIDKETVYPGDKVDAKIKILSPDYFADCLVEGMNFEFREGSKIIGTGQIKYIVNDKLEKASR